MNIEMNDGFNIVYAKIGDSPKNIFLEKKEEVIKFFIQKLNDIDFISINDVNIDKNKLINDNALLKNLFKNED